MERSTCSAIAGTAGSKFCTGKERAYGCRPRDLSHTARFRHFAKLLYPYHPLFKGGPTELEIIAVRSDMLVAQIPDNTRPGIPAWMFDEEICSSVRNLLHAVVEVPSLLEIVKLLEMNGREIRSARDECTSQAKKVCDVPVAIRSSNTAVRKRRKQQTRPRGEEFRVRQADSGVDRSSRRSPAEQGRRGP